MYAIIVGGGKVGFYLARHMLEDGHEVLVIEREAAKCSQIAEELGDIVLRGDGCEAITLASAGMGRADLCVAVTGDDEDNLVACQVAKAKFEVPRTIARINNPKNELIFRQLGIDTTVSATSVILAQIEQELPIAPVDPADAASDQRARDRRDEDPGERENREPQAVGDPAAASVAHRAGHRAGRERAGAERGHAAPRRRTRRRGDPPRDREPASLRAHGSGMNRVAYFGPAGTFTEQAAIAYAPGAELQPFASFTAVMAAVAAGMAEEGIVPIENSIEGSVPETLDILIHESAVSIRAELVLPSSNVCWSGPGREAATFASSIRIPRRWASAASSSSAASRRHRSKPRCPQAARSSRRWGWRAPRPSGTGEPPRSTGLACLPKGSRTGRAT